jgi:three-Cys-motif partner protein
LPAQQARLGSDGLPVIVQGSWSKDKLFFLGYFAGLFNGGMKNLWPVRAYVDLFAGPGRCLDDTDGSEFDGSPIEALACSTPFTHLFFNDNKPEFVDALTRRQERRFPEANVRYYSLDCNEAVSSIVRDLPKRALVLAFIDPWTYEITLDAMASLTQGRSVDLIITFHTTPIKRGVHHEVTAVDPFLGDSKWRDSYWSAEGDLSRPPTVVLIDTFRSGLADRLGYTHFGDPEVIRNATGSPIYYLLFASRNARGLDFWQKASARSRSGQRTMFDLSDHETWTAS